MGLSEGYIKIENDTQLAYYEHVLKHLALREVSESFILDKILRIMTLILSIGAMMASFAQNDNLHNSYVQSFIIVILLGIAGYAVYAQFTLHKNKKELPKMVTIVQHAIECYKKTKENK
ncbi:MAG: hypothetical protein QG617_1122 [Campylobacterota bacterium]|nr:hypothetical protein [Campylobacterota bacterium]